METRKKTYMVLIISTLSLAVLYNWGKNYAERHLEKINISEQNR
ncbi:hypothetical protein [Chryseobacterium paridis]|nr:hypothetical protein [Chryseobacterium paridis]